MNTTSLRKSQRERRAAGSNQRGNRVMQQWAEDEQAPILPAALPNAVVRAGKCLIWAWGTSTLHPAEHQPPAHPAGDVLGGLSSPLALHCTLGDTGAEDPTERLQDMLPSTVLPSPHHVPAATVVPLAFVQPQQVPKPHLPRGQLIQGHVETPSDHLAFLASPKCLPFSSRLPCSCGGGGRSHQQL